MLGFVIPSLLTAYTVFVSPSAGLGADGTRARPVGSIEAALERVRDTPHTSARILVESGAYPIEKPIEIGPADLSTALSIEAANVKRAAVIDGGRALSGWTVLPNGWWTIMLPDVASGKWYFSDLFVNGARRFRPRLPRRGFYTIADAVAPTDGVKDRGYNRFAFSGSDVNASWANPDDLELVLFHNWSVTVGRIASVSSDQVTLKSPTCSPSSWAALPKGNRFFVDNVRDALGTPGDWYLDRKTGVLTYVPMAGESPTTTIVLAPLSPGLIRVHGEVSARRWASNLKLSGLTFRHTAWNIPTEGRSFPQAEADLHGAIQIEGARDVSIDRCTITQVGEYAIEIGAGCKNVRITNSTMTDLGAGGVKIGLTNRVEDEQLLTSDCSVENCRITGYGRRAPAAIGVWIGQSPRNTVAHNTIEDGYYTGVSVGWSWGYGPSASNHNVIESNRIGDIGQNLLSDMGGIYTLGLAPGTTLRNNFIHDISSFSYGGWGIYPDEGSSGLLIDDNIATRCKSAGFHQHYGQDNVVTNNIFAFNREAEFMRTRAEDHRSFAFTHNIVVWDTGTLLASNWTGTGFEMDDNLYLHTGGRPFDFMGESMAQWQARGLDVHSLVSDPLFVDAGRDDYRLKPGSPALKLGFVPFDFRTIGSTLPKTAALPRAWPE
jgi:hypothetical protein